MASEGRARAGSHEARFAVVILTVFLAIAIAVLVPFAASLPRLYPDFFGTWSFARFAAVHPAVALYDQHALFAFQRELAPALPEFFPFTYPPTFRLLLAPLGGLSLAAAYALWVVPALAAYAWVVAWLVGRTGRERAWLAFVAVVLPASTLCVVYGQSGFLTAALLLGAMRVVRVRPVLAGVLLGLLTFKPQMGLLVPVALLAARQWRAMLAAAATAALMVAASLWADGWAPWPAWLGTLEMHAGAVEMMRDKYARIMATPTSAMMLLGIGRNLATVVQAVASLGTVAVVWAVFRRGVTALGTAALALGTFVATPYAFVYDTPLAMAGALLFLAERRRGGMALPAWEVALVVFTMLAPIAVLADRTAIPVLPLLLVLLFAVIARHALQNESDVA